MILLRDLQGPVTVEGHQFNGAMPPWGTSLTDKKISAILTYVRASFGNKGGPITPEQIADARKEFAGHPDSWHESDLQAVPPTAELPGEAKRRRRRRRMSRLPAGRRPSEDAERGTCR